MFRAKNRPSQENPGASPAGVFGRLKEALQRTRSGLAGGLADLFGRQKVIDGDILEEMETLLLSADVGIEATGHILGDLSQRLQRRQLANAEAVYAALKENMLAILQPVSQPLLIPAPRPSPYVILMVGVNGTGKTTTIGKLAWRYKTQGYSILLAAGDTFRAAAVEQLEIWGKRTGVPVVAQHNGADSASVLYDAVQSARARGIDVVIADTAGRLHTRLNLMEELKKINRVIGKVDPDAPHETMLVLDAGTGQNALVQARTFHEAVRVSGITLTKLDGTAKGGIVFAIAQRLGLPIRFIGTGEGIDDLRPFVASEFVDALLER